MRCIICNGEVNKEYGIYCGKHKSRPREKVTNESIDNDKWMIIYNNSSIESLRELAGLDNTMPDQSIDFKKLIK